jgi:ATPase subunit of ABC transporter with duplicated ATPase domains
MLQAFGLSYTVDPRVGPVFEDVSLSLARGQKAVLVGPNGGGKSLLLSILAGRLTPTRGRVVTSATVGYLRQDFDLSFEGTLTELVAQEAPELPTHALARALRRLGLSEVALDQPYSKLSLGERMRAALAVLIADEPDILLLDEPSNHLDRTARDWLASWLSECPEGVLIATHDRLLADAVASTVFELGRGALTVHGGNLSEVRDRQALERTRQRETFDRQREEDRRLREAAEEQYQRAQSVTKRPTGRTYDPKAKAFYSGVQARMDRRAAAMRSRVEKAREELVEKPFDAQPLKLDFPTRPLRSLDVLRVRHLTKAFEDRTLFRDLNLTLERGARVAVLGGNGAGKTTLFRILMGELPADAGTVEWAPEVQVAVLSQGRDRLDPLLPAHRAIDGDPSFVRTALAGLGIRGAIAERPIGVLSVGERTKAEIVAMLSEGTNVLLLDEPTNHLDLPSLEALEAALLQFPGSILFTSHDHAFVDRIATETVNLSERGLLMT